MRGVILAGGLGTRLYPCTKITNKHLLPVYNKPMIFYPLEMLTKLGFDEIMIVTGGNNAGDFLRLLGNGRDFGLRHLHYTYQEKELGIADALSLCEFFAGGEPIFVILGDNIFESIRSIKRGLDRYRQSKQGGMVFLKEVPDANRFGVAKFDGDKIMEIIEKPSEPPSHFAVTGAYIYDKQVFEIIKTLSPSARGEYEITDVNNFYIRENKLDYEIVDGWWSDAGTFDSHLRAANLIKETGANNL
jgi:glucose-1-phosphate thymidylyltransferase